MHPALTVDGTILAEQAPRVVKLYVNRPNLGFSDAGDIEPTQTLELGEEDVRPGHEIELRFVKFQRVKSITVRCIPCNQLELEWLLIAVDVRSLSRRTTARTRQSCRASSSLVHWLEVGAFKSER